MAVYNYERLTAQELKDIADKGKAIAILNLGSIEQHGPHLPVGTDCICGTKYITEALKKVTADADFLLLPMMPFSSSVEHIKFPGTITMDPIFVIQFIDKIGENLMRFGINALVITTGHGGNEFVMEVASRDLRVKGMNTFCIHNSIAEQKLGDPAEEVHAGKVETSVMLAISDDLVRTDKIEEEAAASKDKWFSITNTTTCATQAWTVGDIGVNGVCGAPALADKEFGKKQIDFVAAEIAKALDTIASKVISVR